MVVFELVAFILSSVILIAIVLFAFVFTVAIVILYDIISDFIEMRWLEMGKIFVCDECGKEVTEYDSYLFTPDITVFTNGEDDGYDNVILCSKECSIKFIEKLWIENE